VVYEINCYDESFGHNEDIEFLARTLENYKLAYIDLPLLNIHLEARAIKHIFILFKSMQTNI
jgi:hypothetical protein